MSKLLAEVVCCSALLSRDGFPDKVTAQVEDFLVKEHMTYPADLGVGDVATHSLEYCRLSNDLHLDTDHAREQV